MNKRARCAHCLRAPVACLCHTIKPIDNRVKIVILQHPSEVKHGKGTAKIVELTLNNSEIVIGEDFSRDEAFNAMMAQNCGRVMLLYPKEDAILPAQLKACLAHNTAPEQAEGEGQHALYPDSMACGLALSDLTIIVLDGSWKKAYKMYCVNPILHTLPAIAIDVDNQSNYRIRKSSRADSLSTLEACFELLSELEGEQQSFSALLDSFNFMVEYQLKAMPADVRARYN